MIFFPRLLLKKEHGNENLWLASQSSPSVHRSPVTPLVSNQQQQVDLGKYLCPCSTANFVWDKDTVLEFEKDIQKIAAGKSWALYCVCKQNTDLTSGF